MDPAEFEDTVTKSNEIQTAGALEDLFGTAAKPKFTNVDLTQEIGALHLQIYNVQECISKWSDFSLDALKDDLNEKANSIAASKEEYLTRKKALASKVRQFTKSLSTDGEVSNQSGADDPASSCKALINDFKVEFDFLADSAKYSESCFMAVFKILRDLPDPSDIIRDGLTACLRAHEALKHASEQLNIAATSIGASQTNSGESLKAGSSSVSLDEMNRLVEQLEKEKKVNDSLQLEVADLRTRCEMDVRTREQNLRAVFDRQLLDAQRSAEYTLAGKDEELASLMASLNEYRHRFLEAEQREKMAGAENLKRREVEEKLRVALADLSEAQYQTQAIHAQYDSMQCRMLAIEQQTEKDAKIHAEAMASLAEESSELRLKCYNLERMLDSRPPFHVEELAEKLGVQFSIESAAESSSSRVDVISWARVELWLVDTVRKAHADAVESRIREQEAVHKLSVATEEMEVLTRKLSTQQTQIVSLERDIIAAQSVASEAHLWSKTQQIGDSHGAPQSPLPKGAFRPQGTSRYTANAGHQQRVDSFPISLQTAAILSEGSRNDHSLSDDINVSQLQGGTQDRMIQTILHQRDRFMKAVADKDQEILNLKNKLDRVQAEQIQLRGDNLELYRRLRHLRVSGNVMPGANASRRGDQTSSSIPSSFNDEEDGTNRRTRNVPKRGSKALDEDGEGDAIDVKYNRMYEERLNPFQLEELDRQAVLSRMNFFERGLAFVVRTFFQDRWVRHAFLVYIFIVHFIALVYLFNILNPELVDEVDSQLQAKWSTATMELDMQREHPDVRF